LWGKFKMLVVNGDPPMIFYPGNAGTYEAPSTRAQGRREESSMAAHTNATEGAMR
jgi:hypothetical protein